MPTCVEGVRRSFGTICVCQRCTMRLWHMCACLQFGGLNRLESGLKRWNQLGLGQRCSASCLLLSPGWFMPLCCSSGRVRWLVPSTLSSLNITQWFTRRGSRHVCATLPNAHRACSLNDYLVGPHSQPPGARYGEQRLMGIPPPHMYVVMYDGASCVQTMTCQDAPRLYGQLCNPLVMLWVEVRQTHADVISSFQ